MGRKQEFEAAARGQAWGSCFQYFAYRAITHVVSCLSSHKIYYVFGKAKNDNKNNKWPILPCSRNLQRCPDCKIIKEVLFYCFLKLGASITIFDQGLNVYTVRRCFKNYSSILTLLEWKRNEREVLHCSFTPQMSMIGQRWGWPKPGTQTRNLVPVCLAGKGEWTITLVEPRLIWIITSKSCTVHDKYESAISGGTCSRALLCHIATIFNNNLCVLE